MLKEFSSGEEWLELIKIDIETKYKDKQPVFIKEGKIINDKKKIADWITENLWNRLWVQYKRVNSTGYELVVVDPNPPDDICLGVVESFLDETNKYYKNAKTIQYKLGETEEIYSEEEARKKLFDFLKAGWSSLHMELTSSPQEEIFPIVKVCISEREEDLLINSGYLYFEYKG